MQELSNQRTPRYTSYPTAVQFSDAVGSGQAAAWLGDLPAEAPLSLYLHVPFCREVCWYCACNMKLAAREAPVRDYARVLEQEITQLADRLGGRRAVRHLHWGGGTPTSMPDDCMARIMAMLWQRFDFAPDAEIAVELDPRTFAAGTGEFLALMGVTRASLGVQEFDSKVQKAVNRIQPLDVVARTVDELREAEIGAINFDLMYGLPYQSTETITHTIEKTLSLAPDRIALFGYAHVPWMAKRQRMLPEQALPDAKARWEQCETASRLLVDAGYQRVGLDHFAKPDDEMAVAVREARLRRNFQGYTTDAEEVLIGLGATSISSFPQGYAQNISETGAWARAVEAGEMPIARGVALSGEDRLRREVISDLMCHLEADLGAIAARHGVSPSVFDDDLQRCAGFVHAGLVSIAGTQIRVAETARPVLRVVASAFDAYLRDPAATPRHAVAV